MDETNRDNQELARVCAELKTVGADFALLSSGENVTYVSQFAVPVDFGPAAAQRYIAPLAFFGVNQSDDGTSGLLVSDSYGAEAKQASALAAVHMYPCFDLEREISPRTNFLDALRKMLTVAGIENAAIKLAIEEKSLPAAAYKLLASEFPKVEMIDAGAALERARLIKTPRERDLLRAAAEVNRAGHEMLTAQCQEAGKSEFQMWHAVIDSMEQKAGKSLFVFGELVTGGRCSVVRYPGGPQHRTTGAGELALMDMSTRVDGYWSDCTNTIVIGGVEPTAAQKRYGVAAREAFYAAAETLRPGHRAHEAYDAATATFAKYGLEIGHYAGHQIGVTVNENPRLVPWEQTEIREGMVFSIEPGSYEGESGSVGSRMEKSVIVHQSGPEVICDFAWGL